MKEKILKALENIHEAKTLIEINDLLKLTTVEELKDLQKNIDSRLKMVGNRNDFYNLISILLDNSVKYTPDGGKIEIFFGKKDNKVEFSISNTCEEFLQGDLRYLFDRFYRLDNSRSREGGGYGIGLSIAESIVKAHKGKITATGKGNEVCFRFLLPQNLDKRK